ncbi:MAG: ABC transporter substrate-binding protein/permease [Clostridia bacterium]|nr:ABC transporter substrate-binding protein/permease [Clostridia bacterium]
MKKLFALVLMALLVMAAPAMAQDTLNVGIDPSLAPFGYMDNGEVAGMDAEIAAALADQMGRELNISVISADEIAGKLESGEIDIAFGMLTEENAPEGMLFSDSYASNTQLVIVREDSGIASIEDALNGEHTVAVRAGSAAEKLLGDVLAADIINVFENGADGAADVVDGDVDVLVIDSRPGKNYVARNADLMALDGAWVDADYCIWASDAAIMEEVAAAYDVIKDEKILRSIVNSHIVSEEPSWWNGFKADFRLNFIQDGRWHFLTDGVINTLKITAVALIIGVLLGILVALVRTTHDKTIETMRPGLGKGILKVVNAICNVYLTVIRGTPAVVQLMIMYYIVFASSRNGVMIAMISFGINSGAYVAEIIRGGIMSIDNGQTEAGRSLGFSYPMTMLYIVIPQALKNVLPALANEFIVLLKETSVAGYVAVEELTKGGDIIRGTTYSAFMPLFAVALIYLVMVMFFTKLVAILERRLRNSDH